LFLKTLFIDESYSNEDSGILVESDGVRFLNMNDCRAYDGPEFDQLGKIDVFTIQFSGASWFPSVYEYSKEMRDVLSRKKNEKKNNDISGTIKNRRPDSCYGRG